ncbi:MAG: phytanoyl-CoA dioxygenase family protein [Pseudomonadota bacterium]
MHFSDDAIEELTALGRHWMRGFFSENELASIVEGLAQICPEGGRLADGSTLGPFIGHNSRLGTAIGNVMPSPRAVRLVEFRKSAQRNWSLGWHQDRVIAVRNKCDVTGFRNWSVKAGVQHVEPPIGLFDQMLFARLHLSDVSRDDGCMEIALGSHRLGRVDAIDAERAAAKLPIERCAAKAGDVLIANALTLHRSCVNRDLVHDIRALRVDYGAEGQLPRPLSWAQAL